MALAGLAVLIATVVAYFLQWYQMRRGWQAQNFFELNRDLQSPEQRLARRTIFQAKGAQRPYTQWSQDEGDAADLVFQLLNLAAYLNAKENIPSGALKQVWGATILKAYVAGEDRLRDRRKVDPSLWPFLDQFVDALQAELPPPAFAG